MGVGETPGGAGGLFVPCSYLVPQDLTTIDRARSQCSGADDVTLATLVSAASLAVERYCRRSFWQAGYDELHHGGGLPYLFVDCPPVISVQAVRTGPMSACYLTNTTANAQAATVDVQPDRLVLTMVANAVTTATPFTWASYPTVGALAAAVNASGHGWQATLSDRFAGWATADLRPEQSGLSARQQTAPLSVYFDYLGGYRVNEETGELHHPGGFWPGYLNYRIQYTGGYPDIPDDLQHAVCELVQLAYASRNANPLMQSETLDRYSYSRAATNGLEQLSWLSKQTLNAYKLPHVPRWSR